MVTDQTDDSIQRFKNDKKLFAEGRYDSNDDLDLLAKIIREREADLKQAGEPSKS